MSTQIVILAAGMGSRLGRSLPKPLTELSDGRSIMKQQFDNIHHAFGTSAKVTIVVGYKLEHIIEAFPTASFVYNEQYDQTNTSKSLMRALRASGQGGVLWMNGDVVFDPEALVRAAKMVEADRSFVSVNTEKVSDEEVKYTVDAEGYINKLSKTVEGASVRPSASTTSRAETRLLSSASLAGSTTRITSSVVSSWRSSRTSYDLSR